MRRRHLDPADTARPYRGRGRTRLLICMCTVIILGATAVAIGYRTAADKAQGGGEAMTVREAWWVTSGGMLTLELEANAHTTEVEYGDD